MSGALSRRHMLSACVRGAGAAALASSKSRAGILSDWFGIEDGTAQSAPKALWKWSREARYCSSDGKVVACALCPNACRIAPGARSRCRVRVNVDGALHTLVYGNPAAVHVDPIEKKPLYHFHPTSQALSVGFAGCNFQCLNCQNWELSQNPPEELRCHSLFPEEAVSLALQRGCRSIAYTYNEPSVVYEYMLDTARAARAQHVANVWVTNGYLNPEPLEELCGALDAANVDLKSFSEETYRVLNSGRLQPVLDTLKLLREHGVWFEITTLMVPTYSDSIDMVRRMCGWILSELGPDYPLHLSRFHPQYRLDHLPSTPPSTLIKARATAVEEGLHYVYIGNYRSASGEESNTYCPACGALVVERVGYTVARLDISHGACRHCGEKIAGRW